MKYFLASSRRRRYGCPARRSHLDFDIPIGHWCTHTGALAYNLSDYCLENDDHSELQAEVDDFRAVLDAKVGPLKLFVLHERKGAHMM